VSFLREVFGRGEAKTADEHRSEAGFPGWGPGMVWTEFPTGRRWGRGDTDEAMRLSAVFACIRLLSEAIATLPLDVFKRVGPTRVAQSTPLVLQFAQKNPGMCRVMVGDALILEHERLSARINQLWDRLESVLRQSHKAVADARGSLTPTVDAQAHASLAVSFVLGRLQRFVRTGFQRLPTEHLDASLQQLLR